MARQYALKTFLRQIRRALLTSYLTTRGIDLDLGPDLIKPGHVDQLVERLSTLPTGVLRGIEAELAEVYQLASPGGVAAILREAADRDLDFAREFASAENHHERAFWTYLHHRDVFDVAACFVEMDRFGAGRWRRRFVGAGLTPATDGAGIDALAQQVRRSYAKEGRGRNCHIDYYLRRDPARHCYFAYPEDHASTDLGYDETNRLCRRPRKSAFEVIFVYRDAEGVLEVLAPGGRDRVEDLSAGFCTMVLDLAALPPPLRGPAFDLEKLRRRDFAGPTDPEDRIEAVYLCALRLALPGKPRRSVNLAAAPSAYHPDAVHNLLDEALNHKNPAIVGAAVAHATLRFLFGRDDGQKRRSLTFDLSAPDHCTLRDDAFDQIARKYLRRWGIIPSGNAATAPPAGRAA